MKRPAAPRALKVASVGPAAVTLKWSAPKATKPSRYLVLRDGKPLGKVSRTSYTDSKVKPGKTYRYTVRALDSRNRAGALSSSVRVTVPKQKEKLGPPAPTTNDAPPIAPVTSVQPAAAPTPDPDSTANADPTPAPTATPNPTATPSPTASPTPTPTDTPSPTPTPTDTPSPTPTPTDTPSPTPTATPTPDPNSMSVAMVDRLFWRAGFGPRQGDRDLWVGMKQSDLVDWFLNTPLTFEATDTPPKTSGGVTPIDPRVSDDELVMEWVDRMQRAVNPLPDRLAFFWHRHWAISRDDGSVSFDWAVKYRDRLLKYSNFELNPALNFRDMAYEITTSDAAMSAYLNLNANTKSRPNENYARELMELFCLGPTAPDGTANYTQTDIEGLTRALTGWRLDSRETIIVGGVESPNPDYGKIRFDPGQFYMAVKGLLGRTIAAVSGPANPDWGPSSVNQAIDIVLTHPQHAQFLIRKLWAEFIASPIPQDTLDALVAEYTADNAYRLRPVVRGILNHPLIFESLDEPNLVKPPVVFAAGVLRQLGVPLKGNRLRSALIAMQQQPYRPPNVAGWEGGLSWLNTNTVQARFDMVMQGQYMKYSNYYRSTEVPPPAGSINYPPDIVTESAQEVFDRAYSSVNRPWISETTRASLIAWAGTVGSVPTNNAPGRRQRFYALQAMILGGPDGQVM